MDTFRISALPRTGETDTKPAPWIVPAALFCKV